MVKVIKILSLTLLLAFQNNAFGCNCFFDSIKHNNFQLDSAEIINNIRDWYQQINSNQNMYKKVVKPLMGESSEGGELSGYYEKDGLRKVVAIHAGEMGKSITEYYFKSNELFFVFTTDSLYDKPFYMEGYKISSVEETRFYFYNNLIIKWLNKNKERVLNGLGEKSVEIIKEVTRLRKLLEKD